MWNTDFGAKTGRLTRFLSKIYVPGVNSITFRCAKYLENENFSQKWRNLAKMGYLWGVSRVWPATKIPNYTVKNVRFSKFSMVSDTIQKYFGLLKRLNKPETKIRVLEEFWPYPLGGVLTLSRVSPVKSSTWAKMMRKQFPGIAKLL